MSPLRLLQSGLSLTCTFFGAASDADESLAVKLHWGLKTGYPWESNKRKPANAPSLLGSCSSKTDHFPSWS